MRTLQRIVDRDGEQEVQGMALPVIDASFAAAREWLSDDDPLVRVSLHVISPEAVELESRFGQ